MPLTTRTATAADTAALADLVAELIASHHLTVPPREQLMTAVRHVIATPGAEFIVAEDDGAIVGCLQLSERYSSWQAAPFGYIDDFVVKAAWRSRGVGAVLIERVREVATARGYCRVDLDVSRENRAVGFYARHGFHDSGTFLYRLDITPSIKG
jgi:ribosomal protein S18 acetylase RimI-like enzyme